MDIIKYINRLATLAIIALLSGCWYMSSPDPLSTNLDGSWQWTKTFDHHYKLIETASAGNSKILKFKHRNYGSGFFQELEFYENDIKVDSLFVPDTDNYSSSTTKNDQLYAHYIDGNKNPVVARFRFSIPKKKVSANRIEVNIQRNTTVYDAAADTVIVEYVRIEKL